RGLALLGLPFALDYPIGFRRPGNAHAHRASRHDARPAPLALELVILCFAKPMPLAELRDRKRRRIILVVGEACHRLDNRRKLRLQLGEIVSKLFGSTHLEMLSHVDHMALDDEGQIQRSIRCRKYRVPKTYLLFNQFSGHLLWSSG